MLVIKFRDGGILIQDGNRSVKVEVNHGVTAVMGSRSLLHKAAQGVTTGELCPRIIDGDLRKCWPPLSKAPGYSWEKLKEMVVDHRLHAVAVRVQHGFE